MSDFYEDLEGCPLCEEPLEDYLDCAHCEREVCADCMADEVICKDCMEPI